REGMRYGSLSFTHEPFIHSPEMRRADVDFEIIYQAGHQWQLLRRANRTANPSGIIGCRLLPGIDIFERLRHIELFQSVIENHFKPRSRELQHFTRRKGSRRGKYFIIERGVIPPVRGDGAEFAGHEQMSWATA